MCRGFQQNSRERLKIKAFYLRLSVSNAIRPLPDSLTLYYLPRIDESPLDINESKIRSGSPAFVSLHRVVSPDTVSRSAVFGSRERVRASEGVRFEVYLRDEKLLKGIFRKDERDEWKLECKCVLEGVLVGLEIKEAEVCVAVEGDAAMTQRVEVVVRRRRRSKAACFQRLEEIPESREVDVEGEGCCCCCSDGDDTEIRSDGGHWAGKGEDMEMGIEGVKWAVDVGIWVMCLGVGYLFLKASSKSPRRRGLLG